MASCRTEIALLRLTCPVGNTLKLFKTIQKEQPDEANEDRVRAGDSLHVTFGEDFR